MNDDTKYEPIVDPTIREEVGGTKCPECEAPVGYWCADDCPIGGKAN